MWWKGNWIKFKNEKEKKITKRNELHCVTITSTFNNNIVDKQQIGEWVVYIYSIWMRVHINAGPIGTGARSNRDLYVVTQAHTPPNINVLFTFAIAVSVTVWTSRLPSMVSACMRLCRSHLFRAVHTKLTTFFPFDELQNNRFEIENERNRTRKSRSWPIQQKANRHQIAIGCGNQNNAVSTV